MLTRKDIIQIARWHGYRCVIEKEYDAEAKGKRKSYDRVYIGWDDSKWLHPVDWFYNVQFRCRTMADVLDLFEKVKRNAENDG